jgi:hypothetical protein
MPSNRPDLDAEERCRQETYTYPGCGTPKCQGKIRTLLQMEVGKCKACLDNPGDKVKP